MSEPDIRYDDLGHPVAVVPAPMRIVSLVPSLTESIAVSVPEALVGATDWCSHPADLDVTRVRGTKNPNLQAIRELAPDLVLANKEENRKTDVEALRAAGIAVWVTDIETVDGALTSLGRLFRDALGRPVPAWLEEAERVWREPPSLGGQTAVVAVWRDPWMVVGRSTFTGDVIARLGLRNLYDAAEGRYPHVDLEQLQADGPDVVVLPDEPYRFTADDGPEAFPGRRVALTSGRSLTWYGPSLAAARDLLLRQLGEARIYG